jgi:hypothetical protein
LSFLFTGNAFIGDLDIDVGHDDLLWSIVVFVQHGFQIPEGVESGTLGFTLTSRTAVFAVEQSLVFIIVTVETEQLPITAVRGIVVMIMIPMMHGQLSQVFTREFSCTAPAHPGVHLQRLFAVTLLTILAVTPGIGNNLVKALIIWLFASTRHALSPKFEVG